MATTSISVSILTIGVFSVERYLAICHPFKIKLHLSSLSRAIQAVPVIWFVAFLSSVPVSINHALVQVHNSNSTACSVIIHGISFYLVGLVTSAVFFVSMILICTMYILIGLKLRKSAKIMRSNSESANRSKQRAPKMLSKTSRIAWFLVKITKKLFFSYSSGCSSCFLRVLDARSNGTYFSRIQDIYTHQRWLVHGNNLVLHNRSKPASVLLVFANQSNHL